MSVDSPAAPRIDRAQILRAAASIGVLGAGAHGAPRIMAALCDPQVSADEVSTLVNKEPALYARILRVANSAYYGRARSVTTIERALQLLGLDSVRGIAAAACLDRTVVRGNEDVLVDMGAVVCHSLATAVAAESLARIRHAALASDAFIAGLLHNLGIAVQMHLDPPGVKAMIELRRGGDTREIVKLESECAAVGHEECAAVIFEAWQLPESLVAAARHHHDPMAAPERHRELAALVSLGAGLGLAGGYSFTLEPNAVARNAPTMLFLGLTDADLDGSAVMLAERVNELRLALLQP